MYKRQLVYLVERDDLYWLKWRSPDQSPIASAFSAGTTGRIARDPDKFKSRLSKDLEAAVVGLKPHGDRSIFNDDESDLIDIFEYALNRVLELRNYL